MATPIDIDKDCADINQELTKDADGGGSKSPAKKDEHKVLLRAPRHDT